MPSSPIPPNARSGAERAAMRHDQSRGEQGSAPPGPTASPPMGSASPTPAHPRASRPLRLAWRADLIHLISIPVTNTSVNPARSTGPALFAGDTSLNQLVAALRGADSGGLDRRIHLRRVRGVRPDRQHCERPDNCNATLADVPSATPRSQSIGPSGAAEQGQRRLVDRNGVQPADRCRTRPAHRLVCASTSNVGDAAHARPGQ